MLSLDIGLSVAAPAPVFASHAVGAVMMPTLGLRTLRPLTLSRKQGAQSATEIKAMHMLAMLKH